MVIHDTKASASKVTRRRQGEPLNGWRGGEGCVAWSCEGGAGTAVAAGPSPRRRHPTPRLAGKRHAPGPQSVLLCQSHPLPCSCGCWSRRRTGEQGRPSLPRPPGREQGRRWVWRRAGARGRCLQQGGGSQVFSRVLGTQDEERMQEEANADFLKQHWRGPDMATAAARQRTRKVRWRQEFIMTCDGMGNRGNDEVVGSWETNPPGLRMNSD